jgi:hypothetical protein
VILLGKNMDSTHFYIALFIHLASLITSFGAVLVTDAFGALMLIGKQPLEQVKKVANVTQSLIWLGWSGMIVSGANLIYLKGYIDNLTKIKIFLVLLIGFNGIFLHYIKKNALEKYQNKNDIPKLWMFRMGLASAISQIGWWGALFIGFIHRHIQHNIPWPPNPWIYIFGIAGIFALSAIVGETLFKKDVPPEPKSSSGTLTKV